jgi:hypothetical protein
MVLLMAALELELWELSVLDFVPLVLFGQLVVRIQLDSSGVGWRVMWQFQKQMATVRLGSSGVDW